MTRHLYFDSLETALKEMGPNLYGYFRGPIRRLDSDDLRIYFRFGPLVVQKDYTTAELLRPDCANKIYHDFKRAIDDYAGTKFQRVEWDVTRCKSCGGPSVNKHICDWCGASFEETA